MFEDFSDNLQQVIMKGVEKNIDELPSIRVEAVCHECRYREYVILKGHSVPWMQEQIENFFKTNHPQHHVDYQCFRVGNKVPLVFVWTRLPYSPDEVLPATIVLQNTGDIRKMADEIFPRKAGQPETISVQELREAAIKRGEDPDKYEELVKSKVAEGYAEQQYLIQKWCPICRVREEAIMYAANETLLNEYLDAQSKQHGHKHKVERRIEKAPPKSMISDFHRVQY